MTACPVVWVRVNLGFVFTSVPTRTYNEAQHSSGNLERRTGLCAPSSLGGRISEPHNKPALSLIWKSWGSLWGSVNSSRGSGGNTG